MKIALILLSLLAFTFAEKNEEYFEYTEYYRDYGCSIQQVQKCCWDNDDTCCSPATGPRKCEEKRTLCCKRKVYNTEDATYGIFFYQED